MVKEAKLQVNISYDLENKILACADSLGMSKNDFVRFAVQNYMIGLNQAQEALNNASYELLGKEIQKQGGEVI